MYELYQIAFLYFVEKSLRDSASFKAVFEISAIWLRAGPGRADSVQKFPRPGPTLAENLPGRAGPTWAENSPGPGRADSQKTSLT